MWYHSGMIPIFKTIAEMSIEKTLPTSNRIAKKVGKPTRAISDMLRLYWRWGYVIRKNVKNTKNKTREVCDCSFYYIFSAKGKRKWHDLQIRGEVDRHYANNP